MTAQRALPLRSPQRWFRVKRRADGAMLVYELGKGTFYCGSRGTRFSRVETALAWARNLDGVVVDADNGKEIG